MCQNRILIWPDFCFINRYRECKSSCPQNSQLAPFEEICFVPLVPSLGFFRSFHLIGFPVGSRGLKRNGSIRPSVFFGKVYGGSLYTLSEQQLVEAWNGRRPKNTRIPAEQSPVTPKPKGGDCKGVPPSALYSGLGICSCPDICLLYKDIVFRSVYSSGV